MFNSNEILDTIHMIDQRAPGRAHRHHGHLPAGLRRPRRPGPPAEKIYDKITRYGQGPGQDRRGHLRPSYGIPIVNKRISVTPIALVAGRRSRTEDYVCLRRDPGQGRGPRPWASTSWAAIRALVHKGMIRRRPERLIRSLPEALAGHRTACAAVGERRFHQGGHQHGRRQALMGRTIKEAGRAHRRSGRASGCGQAGGVLQRRRRTTPSWRARSTGRPSEPDWVINVGVSGPGAVHARAGQSVPRDSSFDAVAETD